MRFAAIFLSSAFTVTCEGLCSRSSTPMVTFPPGLMIPGTVTRNLGLKSSQQQEKNEVAYPYIFILLRFSNFIDGEISYFKFQISYFKFHFKFHFISFHFQMKFHFISFHFQISNFIFQISNFISNFISFHFKFHFISNFKFQIS